MSEGRRVLVRLGGESFGFNFRATLREHRPMMRSPLVALLLSLSLLGGACGNGDEDPAGSTPVDQNTAETPSTTEAPAETTSTTTAPAETTTTTVAPRPELVTLDLGSFAVGATTVVVDDGVRDRPLTVEVWFPDRRRRDIQNVLKQPLDALEGVAYLDDCNIWSLSVERRGVDRENPRIEIFVEEL